MRLRLRLRLSEVGIFSFLAYELRGRHAPSSHALAPTPSKFSLCRSWTTLRTSPRYAVTSFFPQSPEQKWWISRPLPFSGGFKRRRLDWKRHLCRFIYSRVSQHDSTFLPSPNQCSSSTTLAYPLSPWWRALKHRNKGATFMQRSPLSSFYLLKIIFMGKYEVE
jgi:hypothetical protein